MGIIEGGQRSATVRVTPDSKLVAMQLDRDAFSNLLKSSSLTRQQVAVLIRQRAIDIFLNAMGIKDAVAAGPIKVTPPASATLFTSQVVGGELLETPVAYANDADLAALLESEGQANQILLTCASRSACQSWAVGLVS